MKKRDWRDVLEDNTEFMITMITIVYNKYRGCTTDDGLNGDIYGNSDGKFLFTNLVDRDGLEAVAGLAFKEAYEAWDGKRPFKPLYRVTFSRMVGRIASNERLHRIRETTLSCWDDSAGNTTFDMMDERTYMIPSIAVDFSDFIESLPEMHRLFVEAILDAPMILGVVGNPKPKDVLGALKRYSKTLGISVRGYWRITTELSMMIKERKDGPHKVWQCS